MRIDLDLESGECWRCSGSGWEYHAKYGHGSGNYDQRQVCSSCNGHGTRTTELGDAILEFVKRRFGLEEKEGGGV